MVVAAYGYHRFETAPCPTSGHNIDANDNNLTRSSIIFVSPNLAAECTVSCRPRSVKLGPRGNRATSNSEINSARVGATCSPTSRALSKVMAARFSLSSACRRRHHRVESSSSPSLKEDPLPLRAPCAVAAAAVAVPLLLDVVVRCPSTKGKYKQRINTYYRAPFV